MKGIFFSFLILNSALALAEADKMDVIILTKKTIKEVIGDYPAAGTEAFNKDFEILHHYQQTRTEADCKKAHDDEGLSVKQLYSGILTKSQIAFATVALADVYATVGANAYLAKSIYKRPRPYDFDGSLEPCISKEGSHAYPSGHTMTARLTARILAAYYPEKEAELLKRSDEFSLQRVIGGVHHPSDVEAGKKLSDHLAKLKLKKLTFEVPSEWQK